jgi:hypothetical protein
MSREPTWDGCYEAAGSEAVGPGFTRVREPYGEAAQPDGHRDIDDDRTAEGRPGFVDVHHVHTISLCI